MTQKELTSELGAKELIKLAKSDKLDEATKRDLLAQETGEGGGNRTTVVAALESALAPPAPPADPPSEDKPATKSEKAAGKKAPDLAEPPPGAGRFDQNVHDPQAVGKASQALHDSGEGASPPAPAGVPGEPAPDPDRHVARIAPPAPTRFDGRDNAGSEAAQKQKRS